MDNISVIKFINSAPPVFKEVKNSRVPWITFSLPNASTNEERHYPNYLIGLLNGSAKHNAIVTGKVQYIVGGGLQTETGAANSFLSDINPLYTADELLNRCAMDIETFGGVRLKLIFDKVGRLKYVTHVPFAKVLTNAGRTCFYISDDWGTYKNLKETDVEVVEYYNGVNVGVKMLAWDIYRPQLSFEPKCYPLPDYVGAIPYIDMDREIANFHYNNLKNGFSGSHILSFFNGNPTDEEKKSIEKRIKDKYTGTDNAGKLIIAFNKPNAQGVEVQTLTSSDYDKMYIELNKQVQQEIFSGHKITSPELFGIATEGSLGDRNATIEKYELFKKTYIANRQRTLEGIFNGFIRLAGAVDKITIIPTEPLKIMFSESTLLAICTKNELREMIGKEPADETSGNDIVDKITQVSPLIGNAIISNLTTNEVRGMVGAPPLANGNILDKVDVNVQMRSDLTIFEQFGVPKSEYTIINSRPFKFENETQQVASEYELISMAFKNWNLNEDEKKIVDVLRENPTIALPDLAKAVKKDLSEVENVIKRLTDNGLLLQSDGSIKVTAPPSETPPPANAIAVMYEYSLAPGVTGAPVLPTTRDFCKKLISLDRLYSREDLNTISMREGRDVWSTRGGWYTKKGSDTSTPYCRHIWKQVIVVKK